MCSNKSALSKLRQIRHQKTYKRTDFWFATIGKELYMHRLGITQCIAGIPNNEFHLKDKTVWILQTIEGTKEYAVGLPSQLAC